jgi:hypothetical protein
VRAVEMLASVVAVATADGDGNGGQNRVSGGSGGNKWPWQWQPTTETAGAGNNQQNAVGVPMVTAVMAAAIMAAWLQRQAGAAARRK